MQFSAQTRTTREARARKGIHVFPIYRQTPATREFALLFFIQGLLLSFHKDLLLALNMQITDNKYWEPHIAALVEAWEMWGVDDAFKNIYARYVVSYLKPQWSAAGRLEGHSGWVTCLTHFIKGNTHMLASGSDDGTVRVWRCDAGTHQWSAAGTLEGHTVRVTCLTHSALVRRTCWQPQAVTAP